jgi:2-phosphosulfolactate phosphatase
MRFYVGSDGKKDFLDSDSGTPVIIDVLRASSTIVTALWAGAKEVIPVVDADEALAIGKKIDAVLIGERHGVKIGGFDYNNSPMEMLGADIKDRTVVITTTNGTRIMVENGIIGSTLNAIAVAEHIMSLDRAYLLASSPVASPEDLNAAFLIEIMAQVLSRGRFHYEVERFVQADPQCQDLIDGIMDSPAGEKVIRLGYEKDVEMICRDINRFPIVPIYNDGAIRINK